MEPLSDSLYGMHEAVAPSAPLEWNALHGLKRVGSKLSGTLGINSPKALGLVIVVEVGVVAERGFDGRVPHQLL